MVKTGFIQVRPICFFHGFLLSRNEHIFLFFSAAAIRGFPRHIPLIGGE
tara:strand:- start:441 stop:587 length:147 start_codon:yes stop_codon:yes gene_type:complete